MSDERGNGNGAGDHQERPAERDGSGTQDGSRDRHSFIETNEGGGSTEDQMANTLGEFVDRCASSRDPDLEAFLADHGSVDELQEELETFSKLSWTVEEPVLPAGRRFGDFEILKRLGGGSFGVVYQARQLSLDRQVALKTLQTGLLADPKVVERFRREARVIAR